MSISKKMGIEPHLGRLIYVLTVVLQRPGELVLSLQSSGLKLNKKPPTAVSDTHFDTLC
jgi:hypothetical protein